MTELEKFELVGLALKEKTTNLNGQSSIDCGGLWQTFMSNNYASIIPGKISEELYAVYYSYDGDHRDPYSFFIGCKVESGTPVPEGLDRLVIPAGTYRKIASRGRMPECIAQSWREIWASDYPRNYQYDFEVYDERSGNWENAVVDIYLGCKQ